jgi:hypothetical protein
MTKRVELYPHGWTYYLALLECLSNLVEYTSKWRRKMLRATSLAAASFFLVATSTFIRVSAAAEQQFSCNGQVVQEMTGPAATQPRTPINLTVSLGDKSKMTIKMADKTLVSRITHNDKLQLKFTTSEFVGEYFHYTGDLFLMYKSGKLARLTCSRS